MTIDLSSMITETRNPASVEIDQLPTLEMLRVINQEDQQVALAVSQLLPEITRAVDAIAAAFGKEAGWSTSAPAPRAGSASWMPANARRPTASLPSR